MRRASKAALALLLVLACGQAWAVRITIDSGGDPDSRLEIRTLTLPDGSEAQLYVLEGTEMRVSIDQALLIADHVEFDLTNRLVRVIGYGRYDNGSETVAGDDLIIDLSDESFQGRDVLITTAAIDVRGDSASRVPGQISVLAGHFSPCSRCDQSVEDYGFEAGRIELFPGDRLVAYDVTVLLRARPLFTLPLLVVPLGPPERRPQLSITRGSASERAAVEATWPYVAGPDAYGTMSVRYFADVTPGTGSWPETTVLGGGVVRSYLGGGVDHRFYTERGKGELRVDYAPGFVEDAVKLDDTLQADLHYATEDVLGPPSLSLSLTRDDTALPRLWEYGLATSNASDGVQGTFTSQGYVDLDPLDDVSVPGYAGPATPLRTIARLQLQPEDLADLRLEGLRLDRLLLDLGAFEDSSNPGNRSAALTPTVTSGRLRDGYTLTLDPVSPWGGFSVQGSSAFLGSYYGTGERLIDWTSTLALRQALGDVGSLSIGANRVVQEGETPFRFDRIALRNRTDVNANLLLAPLPWARLEVASGYVFVDNRNPDALGLQPLKSTLTLFGDTPWIEVTLANDADLSEGDPGTLDATLDLRARGALEARFTARHVEDLKVTPDRLTGAPVDDTHTTVRASLSVGQVASVSVEGGYVYAPPAPVAGEPPEAFDPLVLAVTLGSTVTDDAIPGVTVRYTRDLNAGALTALGVEARAALGPLRFSAKESLAFPSGDVASSTLRVAWPGVAAAQADGVAWLPPSWLGLADTQSTARTVALALEDAPLMGNPSWQLRYSTVLDPALSAGSGGRRNSALTARALLTDRQIGAVRFSVDAYADLQLPDDVLPQAYLRRANLGFGLDLYQRVGLQGTLGYNGVFDSVALEVRSARLQLQQVALVVRPLDELYVGAVLDDVWDFSGNDPSALPFNLQPTFLVAWNRCCWALYGSWNSGTGAVRISLTTPGSNQGLVQEFPTALTLPRREP